MKRILFLASFISFIAIASYIQLPGSGGGGGSGDVVGPASSVVASIPSYADTSGKLLQDPAQFFIDAAADDFYCASGARCNSIMTSQTVLTAEETFRSATVNGNHYAQNPGGTRSCRMGSRHSASANTGFFWYDSTLSKLAELTVVGSLFGSNLDTFFPALSPDFDFQGNDLHFFTNKGATATIGATPSISFLSNGSIWQFAKNDGSGSYPQFIMQSPDNVYGMAHSFFGGQMDVINATNLTAYGSPANGFEGYFKGSDYLTGTGNGGDMGLRGGNSSGGIGGHIPLIPGTGATRSGVTYSDYGFAMTPGTATITADNQSVTINSGVVVVNSDSATATDRTIVLADGTRDGQIAQLIFDDATDAVELLDDDTQFCGSADWTPTNRDSLSITWVIAMSCWVESSRSVN